jgi:DNA polymerase I
MLSVSPHFKEAYELMHDGCIALSEIEQNGMRIDVDYCINQQKHLTRKIDRMETLLHEDSIIKEWKAIYKEDFNFNSNAQLSDVLFVRMKIPHPLASENNPNPTSVNKETLAALDVPIVKNMLQMRKLKKARDTYMANLINESVGGILRPFFGLHNVRSFRSSSTFLNFQNIPIRDPEIKRAVRRAFIPRDNHVFGGVDYSNAEVRISYCYHKDPAMLRYLTDPSTNMHRDAAMDCYLIDDPEMVHKDVRQTAKGAFVFAQFYGDYYINSARNLWAPLIANENPLMCIDNKTKLIDHLHSRGILTYEDFVEHIRKVEDKFWNERFKFYTKWKKVWKREYDKNGYFDFYTGFRCSGFMKKNDVLNYQIQGTAFHCLLWSLIQLHKWLKKYKLKTLIVGQIHDEVVLDMHESEIELVLAKCKEIMTVDIVKHWPWIEVPLEVEADFCPPGDSWYNKAKMKIPSKSFSEIWLSHLNGYQSVYTQCR